MVFGLFGGEKKRNQQLWAEVVQAIAHQDKEGLSSHLAWAVLGGPIGPA